MNDERGFSYIEVLVIFGIIGILAAIGISVFLHNREGGWMAQSQSSLKDAALAIQAYSTMHEGDVSELDGASSTADNAAYRRIVEEGFKATPSVDITVATAGGGTIYCITAVHQLLDPSNAWGTATYNSTEGSPLPANECTPVGIPGGLWGEAA